MDCDEKSNESKKSDGKNDKEFHDYLFSNRARLLEIMNKNTFSQHLKLLYASAGYSLGVFSPPDSEA